MEKPSNRKPKKSVSSESLQGRRNLIAGEAYEHSLVRSLNKLRAFPILGRTQEHYPALDAKKVDIMPVNLSQHKEFPFAIQAKHSSSKVLYPKLMDELEANFPNKIPVIFHKYVSKSDNGKTSVRNKFAILPEDNFISLMGNLERYRKGYGELMCYWDTLSDKQQKELAPRLTAIGL